MKKNEKYLKKIFKLKQEIKTLKKNKKFGLIWEDKPENFEFVSKEALPILVEKGAQFKDIVQKGKEDEEYNILIEGDNYHSLSVLNYTHRGKVDVIYIDPPYNTGSNDWKYNNNYIDKEDTFKHSKWLSFMEKRLKIAKMLLSKDGVLVCAIDENERPTLELLLWNLFRNRKIVAVSIVHNPQGIQGNNFSYTHEYALFVFKDKKGVIKEIDVKEREEALRDDTGNNYLRTNAKNCFYPILVKDSKIIGFGEVPDDNFHPRNRIEEKEKGIIKIWPLRDGKERKWTFARQSIHKIKKSLFIKHTKKRGLDVFRKINKGKPKTVWQFPEHHAGGKWGTKLVNDIIGKNKFNFPKSLMLVKDILKLVSKKDSIILDFFAGSGTTGHAVLEMNKNDGGNRKFILCTNNENKIAEDVTYARIKKVCYGYRNLSSGKEVERLGSNLKYLKTDFIKVQQSLDDLKEKIVEGSTQILSLKENTFKEVLDKYNESKIKIFENKNKYTAILFDSFYFDQFLLELNKLKDKKVMVYVFSYGKDIEKEEFGDLEQKIDFSIEPIPEKLLETYQRIFGL